MIFDTNKLDVLGQRNDGGVDLCIISSGSLDDSVETQTLLLDKIENYLVYIKSDEFKKDFPMAQKDNIRIIMKLNEKPSEIIYDLLEKIIPWVNENDANFVFEIK